MQKTFIMVVTRRKTNKPRSIILQVRSLSYTTVRYSSHVVSVSGIVVAAWPCGQIVMLNELFGSESKSQVYASIYSFFYNNRSETEDISKYYSIQNNLFRTKTPDCFHVWHSIVGKFKTCTYSVESKIEVASIIVYDNM